MANLGVAISMLIAGAAHASVGSMADDAVRAEFARSVVNKGFRIGGYYYVQGYDAWGQDLRGYTGLQGYTVEEAEVACNNLANQCAGFKRNSHDSYTYFKSDLTRLNLNYVGDPDYVYIKAELIDAWLQCSQAESRLSFAEAVVSKGHLVQDAQEYYVVDGYDVWGSDLHGGVTGESVADAGKTCYGLGDKCVGFKGNTHDGQMYFKSDMTHLNSNGYGSPDYVYVKTNLVKAWLHCTPPLVAELNSLLDVAVGWAPVSPIVGGSLVTCGVLAMFVVLRKHRQQRTALNEPLV